MATEYIKKEDVDIYFFLIFVLHCIFTESLPLVIKTRFCYLKKTSYRLFLFFKKKNKTQNCCKHINLETMRVITQGELLVIESPCHTVLLAAERKLDASSEVCV